MVCFTPESGHCHHLQNHAATRAVLYRTCAAGSQPPERQLRSKILRVRERFSGCNAILSSSDCRSVRDCVVEDQQNEDRSQGNDDTPLGHFVHVGSSLLSGSSTFSLDTKPDAMKRLRIVPYLLGAAFNPPPFGRSLPWGVYRPRTGGRLTSR